ncbi:LysR family transcriptional regulator [Paraburkholderia sp. BCC1886]|uniref:LysR family transcriptional regulator n=1 Tax=Paraburkholderia sp. BCC1886 TaxID=2562670 RepID=UPI0011835D8A|nr:LysR family transcriptional regulator [Paraburkholderia sp. BCC1886]
MQIKALRLFVHVAATGSFIDTARHFGVPGSSVSRYIASLEEDIGQRLLFRHTRAVRLTEAGERYYVQVREALELLDAATEMAADKDAAPRGLLRVNAPVALGRRHIAPLIAAFQREHRELSIELMLTDAFVDPIQEGADVTVRIGKLADSSLVARTLGPQRYLVCASPGYLKQAGTPSGPDDLAAHNCLIYKGHLGVQRWYFCRPGDPHYRPFEISGDLRSNNAEVLVAAALEGQGVVLFPSWLYDAQAFRTKKLVRLLPDWLASVEPEPSEIHLVFPESRLRSRKVKMLSDFLIERIGTPPYWEF